MTLKQKRVLITGITGQDGSFLAEYLLEKGIEVWGLHRRTSTPNVSNIHHLLELENMHLIEGDLTDLSSLISIIHRVEPDCIYNLASQSFVPTSWTQPIFTVHATGLGALHVFEATRIVNPKIKIYQASSSEMFGSSNVRTQDENTPLCPNSPYGSAKVFAHNTARNYREAHDMFISCGILFNHESERRGMQFVTKKIAKSVAEIVKGNQKHLSLGNLQAKRDWGFAGDYIKVMVGMLEHVSPDVFVVGTGRTHSVQDFVESAFGLVDLKWQDYVRTDPKLFRQAEIESLCADSSKANEILGWTPTTSFSSLVERMVTFELNQSSKKTL
jgi:GDPmannose 4,6-dehydratase